jgi:hypothetical protein
MAGEPQFARLGMGQPEGRIALGEVGKYYFPRHPITADFGRRTWCYSIRYGVGLILLPGMILLSRLVRRPIAF